jgi:hypothetical protein
MQFFVKKYPMIPTLPDYHVVPNESFWRHFPFSGVPSAVSSKVNSQALRSIILLNKDNLTIHQFKRGMKLIEDLQNGASAYQLIELPPTDVPNCSSAYEFGQQLTDKIATWVDAGIVKGPFKCPPVPGFRANSLMVVKRGNNYRPIINMSDPKDRSFNDNLDKLKIEKVHMSTARDFSYSLKEAGMNSRFSKFDFKDAYKNIPARKEDWRLQGFRWLGRYFFESQMIFGGTPSVSNFDRLSNTVVRLAIAESKLPPNAVHRCLDDIPVVSPASSDYTEKFGRALKRICSDCNILIAENCPHNEKAFENQTQGTVLGVGFDSRKMIWFLSAEKADKIVTSIASSVSSTWLYRKDFQKTMGLVNNLAMMAPFLKFYKARSNQVLAGSKEDYDIVCLDDRMRADLLVCARVAEEAKVGLPIPSRPGLAPLFYLEFYSDAAGAKFALQNGERVALNAVGDRGIASVLIMGSSIRWSCVESWGMHLLDEARDSRGHYFGSKTTLLEAVGVLLPFVCVPELLRGRHLVFKVDNKAVVYGWKNGGVKFDCEASIVLRAVHLLASYLGATVHVMHQPRRSDDWSILVDNLSRKSTTTEEDKQRVAGASQSKLTGQLKEWLEEPGEDWDLPMKLLEELEGKFLN